MRPLQRAVTLAPWFLLPLTACQPAAQAPAVLGDTDRAAIQQVADNMLAAINATPSDPDGSVQAGFAPECSDTGSSRTASGE